MKILMPALHYYPVVGGIETWTRHIAEKISQKAEVFVVTGKVKNQPKEEQIGKLKITRTSLFALKNLSHSPLVYTLFLLPFVFFKSFILIKKEKINILHCQGFLSSILGFCLSEITGVPYIATVQRLESKRNPFKNFIYRKAAVCIGASRAVGDYFRQIGCKNVEVIPNGVDLKRFENLERKPHTGFVVMTVARLEKVKGINYLIEALLRLNLNRERFSLLVIGDGSERKNLESLVEKLNLKEKVKFLGEIPNERIPEYLAEADCFVLPSLKEGFGIAVLEAQAAGVPVLGSKVGGILDLIEDGKTGLLVAPADPQAIADAVNKIYSGLKFPRINLEKYNWQNIADKVYSEYDSIYRAIKSPAMKFIIATPIYPPEIGGPAVYSQKLKEGLEKKGHEAEVISYQGLKKYPQPLRIFLYFLKILKSAKGCDLIYSFNLISCGLPVSCVSKIARKQFFVRIGGDFLWERAVEAGRTKKPLREYYQDRKTLKEKFWIWLMRKIFNQTGKIIFTSDFQRNIYLKYFGIKERETAIIKNPFPETEIIDNQLPVNRHQLLWAGRLIKLKNIDFLIDVFYKVLLKTNEELILKIIGDGPIRKDLKTDKNVVFIPPLSHQELLKEIRQSYLCLLPSLTEITPNFALECIKLQKPILLTKETGYYDDFKDNLIFIDPKDKSDLEEKIINLLDIGNYLDYIERIKKIPTQRSWDDVIKEHEENFIHRGN